jgi:hypothetical protein
VSFCANEFEKKCVCATRNIISEPILICIDCNTLVPYSIALVFSSGLVNRGEFDNILFPQTSIELYGKVQTKKVLSKLCSVWSQYSHRISGLPNNFFIGRMGFQCDLAQLLQSRI